MPDDLAQRYFDAIQNAWSPFADRYRVIPFCTPVFERPTAVVIGTNHSDFVEGGGELSEHIADELTTRVPRESTFLVHDHKFASGLLAVCERAGITVDEAWIGTNRCAVQTGPDGIAEIENDDAFADCQITMDRILRDFLSDIGPRNVVLTGKYAVRLYYAKAAESTFEALKPRDIKFPGADMQTRIIPIQHPSRATFWQPAAERLSNHFVR